MPYVLLSCAMSVDGFIDDTSPQRLLLSSDADFDRVDGERAASDAILIGANTIRRDNPRGVIRSASRRADRQARGLLPDPVKVTVTSSGDLDPEANWWHRGDALKLVYCPDGAVPKIRERLGGLAEPVGLGASVNVRAVVEDLGRREIGRLMVEGGSSIHTQFLTAGLADEIQLAVAPFFVGDPGAPRFTGPGTFPDGPERRMKLADLQQIGDVAVLRYLSRQ
jgi:riboflavin-specific deaminase-like protein